MAPLEWVKSPAPSIIAAQVFGDSRQLVYLADEDLNEVLSMNLALLLISLIATDPAGPYVQVLGIAQDAGYPQAACARACCARVHRGEATPGLPTCLALVDPRRDQAWMFEATPHFPAQLHQLEQLTPAPRLSGIFLTHGHMGHYTGLMYLGREVMGAAAVPVYAMPRMVQFLQHNGPWDQLVRLHNIALQPLAAERAVDLGQGLQVTPFLVPHRDEYTETVGYLIQGPRRKVVFIPDIDKWESWQRPIEELIGQVDRLYLDGTFFDAAENPGRDMSEIPHPFISESMVRFAALPAEARAKIVFIHFNHTNAALLPDSEVSRQILAAGFGLAREGDRLEL